MTIDIYQLIRDFGMPVALLVFFVWWSWIRERRLSDRLDKVEDEFRATLKTVIADNTKAMQNLCDRPCVKAPDP